MIASIIASGLGSGYLPGMPGTWGSVVGVLLAYFILNFYGLAGLSVALVMTFFGGWVCSHNLVKQKPDDLDPSYIVIDEIAGIILCILGALWWQGTLRYDDFILLFFGFRVFDILKPFPIHWIESRYAKSIKGAAFGIMIDDILAAFYTLIAFAIYKTILSSYFIFR
jgi:phosphatidylglycerophosphatase A